MTEGDSNGKESQEGRQEIHQEGQVTRTRFPICFCKGVASNRGAFFVSGPPRVTGSAGFQPASPPGSTGFSLCFLLFPLFNLLSACALSPLPPLSSRIPAFFAG